LANVKATPSRQYSSPIDSELDEEYELELLSELVDDVLEILEVLDVLSELKLLTELLSELAELVELSDDVELIDEVLDALLGDDSELLLIVSIRHSVKVAESKLMASLLASSGAHRI